MLPSARRPRPNMTTELQRTSLHALHVDAGAKMVDFSGWHMPLQYAGILAEHEAVRTRAGVFDVSHMGEVDFVGPRAIDAVQHLITNDMGRIQNGQALYTPICTPEGGIVDDCIVYRLTDERIRVVINAANIEKDIAHMRAHLLEGCGFEDRCHEFALLAVQGPEAVGIVDALCDADMADIPSFGLGEAQLSGVSVLAARTGYTGEDGFELFVARDDAPTVWRALLERDVQPIGLGARDTLRMEAKLCLYGNDIDEQTTPLEAALGWTVKLDAGPFVGSEALAAQKAAGIERKLVGLRVLDRGIPRAGWEVHLDGTPVGRVTSGGPAPTLGGSIAMAYVAKPHAQFGNRLTLTRGRKSLAAEVVKGPFYRRNS